jgi:hypothetical protein
MLLGNHRRVHSLYQSTPGQRVHEHGGHQMHCIVRRAAVQDARVATEWALRVSCLDLVVRPVVYLQEQQKCGCCAVTAQCFSLPASTAALCIAMLRAEARKANAPLERLQAI